jgi:short-subunit dehydrogenase
VILVARTVGGLEEVDDEIQRAGGTATLVPLDLKDFPALDRWAPRSMSAGESSTRFSAMPACWAR